MEVPTGPRMLDLQVNDWGSDTLEVWDAQTVWLPTSCPSHAVVSPNSRIYRRAPSATGVLPGRTDVYRYPNGRYGMVEWVSQALYYDPAHPQLGCTPTAEGIDLPGKELLWADLEVVQTRVIASDAQGDWRVVHADVGEQLRRLLDPPEDFFRDWERHGRGRDAARVRLAWQMGRHSVLHLVHGNGARFAELRRQFACVTRNILNAWAWMYYTRWVTHGTALRPPPQPWHFVGVFVGVTTDVAREAELARKFLYAGVPVYRILPRNSLNPRMRIRDIGAPGVAADYGAPEVHVAVVHDGFYVSMLLSDDPSQFTFRATGVGQPLEFVGSVNALGQLIKASDYAGEIKAIQASRPGVAGSHQNDEIDRSGHRSVLPSGIAKRTAGETHIPASAGSAAASHAPWGANFERRMRHLLGQTAPWSLSVLGLNFAWRAAMTPTNCPLPKDITNFLTFAPDPASMQWSLYGPAPPPASATPDKTTRPFKRARYATSSRPVTGTVKGGPSTDQNTPVKSAKGLPRTHGWLHLRDLLRAQLEAIQPSPDGPEHVDLYKRKVWDDIINQESFHRLFHCPPLVQNNSVFAQSLVAERQTGEALPSPRSALLYHGQMIQAGEDLPDELKRFVLWELAEINFRLELLQLDAMSVKREDWDARRRNELYMHCFPDGGRIPDIAVSTDSGLGAQELPDMAPYARAFGRLMADWVVEGKPVLDALTVSELQTDGDGDISASTVVRLMDAYVQTFSRSFGRPPTVPRVKPPFVGQLPQSVPQ